MFRHRRKAKGQSPKEGGLTTRVGIREFSNFSRDVGWPKRSLPIGHGISDYRASVALAPGYVKYIPFLLSEPPPEVDWI